MTADNLDPKPWFGADQSRRSRYSRFAPRFAPPPRLFPEPRGLPRMTADNHPDQRLIPIRSEVGALRMAVNTVDFASVNAANRLRDLANTIKETTDD